MTAENRGPQVAAVAILFLTLTWVFVGLRCYVRIVIVKGFGMDDWLSFASLVLFTLYCVFVFKGVKYGTGQHLANLPPQDIPVALKWWWCCELAYISSAAVFKCSICVFLARVCVTKTQMMTIRVILSVIIIYSIFYFVLVLFQCTPIQFFWTQYIGAKGHCVPPSVITGTTYAFSGISCWADWTLATLPVILVWKLKMNPRTKISVALILALGALGSTATIVRIPYIRQLAQTDFLYATTDVAIWSTVEPGIGITAGAMATLRPLFRSFLSKTRLLGSSIPKESKDTSWPMSRQVTRRCYLGNQKLDEYGREELGLRSDVADGIGVTTTIKSMNTRDKSSGNVGGVIKIERSTSQSHLNGIISDSFGKYSSSEEFLPVQRP